MFEWEAAFFNFLGNHFFVREINHALLWGVIIQMTMGGQTCDNKVAKKWDSTFAFDKRSASS
jgi:hypothetical protein